VLEREGLLLRKLTKIVKGSSRKSATRDDGRNSRKTSSSSRTGSAVDRAGRPLNLFCCCCFLLLLFPWPFVVDFLGDHLDDPSAIHVNFFSNILSFQHPAHWVVRNRVVIHSYYGHREICSLIMLSRSSV